MSMKIRVFPLLAVCSALATFGLPVRAVEAPAVQASASVNALPAGAAPAFSGAIDGVVTLAKSGVDESVVISYIKNSPGPFQPSAEEIIKLRDEGISTHEINAMLERGSELREQAAATAVAQPYAQQASQAPVITEQPPAGYADTSNGGYTDSSQPGSTVVYVGGDNSGYGDAGYGYPPYWWGYPSTFFVGGFISTPFFFPFPCFFHGTFFPHGCFFPHGGFVHGGFHGSFSDHNGFHSGFHGGTMSGFRGGSVSGFRGGTMSGFRGTSISGFRGGSVSGFRGATVSGFRGGVVGGGFRGTSGSFHGAAVGGGFHGPSMGGFHGSMGGGGFHGGMGGMGGGGFHGGGGGGHR